MSEFGIFVGRLGVHQDFFWFGVLLLWSFALVAWWRHPARTTTWRWLPWAGGAGALCAFSAFCVFDPPFNFFYERLVPGTTSNYVPALIDPNLFGDVAIGVAFAAMLGGWLWQALRGEPRALRWLAITGAVGLAVTQAWEPRAIAWALALLVPLAALTIASRERQAGTPASWVALGAAALLPLLSTIGPLAWALGMAQRTHMPTPFGVLFAVALIVAATLALGGLLAGARHGAPQRAAFRRELRPLTVAALAWLLAGLGFAVVTGRNEAQEVKTNRLRTAAARAATFDPALLNVVARVAAQLPAEDDDARHRLELTLVDTVRSTPFLTAARLVVLRDGWRTIIAAAPREPGPHEQRRPATPDEQRHWREATPYNAYSPVPDAGQPYYCRAPLVDGAGHTLAWLEYVREEFYSSMERKWRTAPLLVTALGLIIATFLAIQRAAARDRAAAEQAAAVAAEASRMKTAFLAKVSHELRTPLQSILGYCELLQADPNAAQRPVRLAALRQHGELMLRLVNDLLDLSTIESGGFKFADRPVALGELVRQTVESLRPRAEAKELAIDCQVAPEVPGWLRTDPERWRQIVLNLVGNAVKFTARGGITVALGVVAGAADATTVELVVSDTGPGVPIEQQPRLFQTFSRLELTAEHEGVGLGLALVAALCRAAGGTVTLASDGRTGARFTVRMTLPPAAPSLPPADAKAVRLNRRRVLVADDNALIRELFIAQLSRAGALCEGAADGAAALARLQQAPFDALVVDIAMPGLDGFEVTRRLRAAGRSLRIVGVSAHARERDRARALEVGMNAFVAKPVPMAELVATVAGAEGAPVADASPPRRRRMAELFRDEAPARISALESALACADWDAVRTAAHWLRNSAVALDDEQLLAGCAALEQAAETQDGAALAAEWLRTKRLLGRWQQGTALPFTDLH